MTTYIKISIELTDCETCKGVGHFYEKFYHNQVRKCVCYDCGGKGKIEREVERNVTDEINGMKAELSKLKSLIS